MSLSSFLFGTSPSVSSSGLKIIVQSIQTIFLTYSQTKFLYHHLRNNYVRNTVGFSSYEYYSIVTNWMYFVRIYKINLLANTNVMELINVFHSLHIRHASYCIFITSMHDMCYTFSRFRFLYRKADLSHGSANPSLKWKLAYIFVFTFLCAASKLFERLHKEVWK